MIAALATLALLGLAGAEAPARPRSVLVVLADDVAQADVEEVVADGWAPNLARLAAEGWTFEPTPGMRGGFGSPVCSPARYMLQFGRWHFSESGVGCEPYPGPRPSASLVSLGDVGLAGGCSTVFAGKWHLGEDPLGQDPWWRAPAAHGWQLFYGTGGNLPDCGGSGYGGVARGEWLYADGGFAAPALTALYQPLVNERDVIRAWTTIRGPKLVLWTPSLAHGPFHWPPEHTDDGDDTNDFLLPGYPTVGASRPKYLAMIAALDVSLGRVLAHLDPASDLVVFAGDNGTPPTVSPRDNTPGGNGFPFPAKATCGERGVRVPFVLWGGGLAPRVSPRLAALVDVLPTVAAYLGVPPPAGIDGVSLVAGPARGHALSGVDGAASDYCARTARWKLRRRGLPPNVVEELYDLSADPNEHRALDPATRPLVSARLRALLAPHVP